MPFFSGLASTRALTRVLPMAIVAVVAACSDSATAPDTAPVTAQIVVDDGASTVYVALSDSARVVTVADPATSTAWDLSFYTTTIAASPNVSVYCLCGNESATNAAVMAMTPSSESPAFESVSAASIPAAASFTADGLSAHPWYRYNLTGNDHQIWPAFNVYLVKRGTSVYKVQFTNYYNAAGESRHIAVRYARLQ